MMSEKELARLCRLWQKRLRLLDWKVEVSILPAEEMGDCDGHNYYEDEQIWAKVRLADAPDLELEETLVHELLHLRLSAWPGPYDNPPLETAVNLLADAFMTAYHGSKKMDAAHKRALPPVGPV